MGSEISRILGKVTSQELSHYLGLYTITPSTQFAVLKISGSCLEGLSLEQIAKDLSDIYSLGLIPTVTHGWGSSLTERLKESGIESKFVDGDRYTDATIMGYVEKIAEETANNLLKAIEAKGGRAKIIGPENGVIIAKDKENPRYGEHNGDIVRINPKPIYEAISEGFIPVVSPIGISEHGKKRYNINAAVVGAKLARVIDPVKYIMVTSSNGVLDKNDKTIGEIVLRRDLKRLITEGIITEGMLKNVDEAQQSLKGRENGDDRSVQMVSPGNLLYELFTHKGAGTFIRNGYIVIEKPVSGIEREVVKSIIEGSFNKRLGDNYFEDLAGKEAVIYLERNNKGVAIVIPRPTEEICPYLDILAVANGHERNGLGTDLVTAIRAKHPKLCWRSKTIRPANDFYFEIADGHQRFVGIDGQSYNGFWIGLTLKEAEKALAYMMQKPPNFKES